MENLAKEHPISKYQFDDYERMYFETTVDRC